MQNVSSTTLRLSSNHKNLLDTVLLYHKVGGFYLTAQEKRALQAMLSVRVDFDKLPCRLLSAAFYFVSPEMANHDEQHLISRFSLRLTDQCMSQMHARCLQRGPPHYEKGPIPITHFVSDIVKDAEIVDEEFILKNCLTLYPCLEHEPCKKLHGSNAFQGKPIHLACCNAPDCASFTSFQNQKERLRPRAAIHRFTMDVKDTHTVCSYDD